MNVRDNQAHYKRIESYLREILQEYMKVAQKSAEMVQGVPIDGMLQFKDYPHLNNQVERLFNEFGRNMDVIVKRGISNEWSEANRVSDKLIERYSRKTGIAPNLVKGYGERNLEALEAFTERKHKGLGLSERVWNYSSQFKGELELALSLGIGEGRSASEISRDIRGYLREPNRLYRKVRNEFGELVLSKNAKMYRSGQGVYRSSYKNALRLTRTEINRSYRTADYERRQQLDFVVGIEVRRSNHDYDCPVCEALKGRYPKDFLFTNWHPNCRCYSISILSTEAEFIEQQRAILEGREVPMKSKNEVRDMPNNFTKWVNENSNRIKSDRQVYDVNKEWERIKNIQVDLTQIYGKDTEKVKFRLATPEQTIKVGDFNKANERINVDIEFPVNIIKSDGTVIKSSGFNASMTATIDNEKKIITLMKVDVDEKLRRNGIAEYMAWKIKEVTPNGYKIVGSGVYSGGGSGLIAKLEKTGYFNNVSVSRKQLPLWMIENRDFINNQSQSLISFVKAKSAKEAEEWVTKNIPFIKSADYSGISRNDANRLNEHLTYLQNKGFMKGSDGTIKLVPFRGKVSDPVGGGYQMLKHGQRDARLRIDVWSDKKFKALEKKAEKQVEKQFKKVVANWEAALATIENDLAAYYKDPAMEKMTWGDDRLDVLLKRKKAIKDLMEKDIASFKANRANKMKRAMDFVSNVSENMEDNLTHEMGHALNANLQTNYHAYSSEVRSLLKRMKKKYDYYPDREGIIFEKDSNLFDKSMLEYGLKVSEYACTKGAEYFAESFTMFMKGKELPDKELEELFKLIVRQ